MAYNWDEILKNSVVDNQIQSTHLEHMPKMSDCPSWQNAEFLGRVKHSFKYTTFDGGLVRWNGKIYYINSRQLMALSGIYKWNTGNMIRVIPDKT